MNHHGSLKSIVAGTYSHLLLSFPFQKCNLLDIVIFLCYGKDEHCFGLLESLRTAGCEICLVQDNCQHFAVIDEKIVWCGSMNLLSRDDVEDNIMRLESQEVAEELLGMTLK